MLAVAAGHDPEGFAVEARGLESLREPPVAAGLPSTLLLRRPDLLSAEATLAAASANVAVARAAFLPTISLTATGGIQNPAVQAAVTTLTGTGPTLTLGAALVQGVFDGGQRRAVREEALAREQEMLAGYRSAVRNALLDVETTLALRQSLDAQRGARERALAQTTLALQAARARYQAGAGDFLALLDAQRSVHAARDANAQYRLARFQACVALFKALGGGWQQP
jgi:outer membrane protein, multidrug efflux system